MQYFTKNCKKSSFFAFMTHKNAINLTLMAQYGVKLFTRNAAEISLFQAQNQCLTGTSKTSEFRPEGIGCQCPYVVFL